jgi:GTP-binding protein EngB required for normal cell division
VDLPGYGFAFVKDKLAAAWRELMHQYLTLPRKGALKRVLLLVDSRHGLKTSDKEFIMALDSARRRYQVVLTKTDLVDPVTLAKMTSLTIRQLSSAQVLQG